MNLPITVTQNDLLEILLNVAPSRPVFIWGAPCIGKSALIKQFAKEIVFCCSKFEYKSILVPMVGLEPTRYK